MRRVALAAVLLAPLALAAGPARAEPFAPKVVPPAGIKASSPEAFGAKLLAAAKVPDRGAVPVPPYPGAKLINARDDISMEANGEKVECMPYIKLYTPDAADKVEAFYRKELKDYQFKSEFGGMIRLFWTGAPDLNPLDVTRMCTTPNVSIGAAMPDALAPGAKTTIEITYRPK